MDFIKTTGFFESTAGDGEKKSCKYYIYEPENHKSKAIVQISHGMCEYIERYEEFAELLVCWGFLVCGHDHIGHGKSVGSEEELGYFSKKNGWSALVDDLHTMTRLIKERYPGLPVILLGHSMGSFVARLYLTRYPNEARCAVIMGTGNAKLLSSLGIAASRLVGLFKGERHRSRLLSVLIFGSYNKRISKPETPMDWLTHDKAIVKRYLEDRRCSFTFTASAFKDLTTLLNRVSGKSWARSYPKRLPTLIISGTGDPVGSYGRGVLKVYSRLAEEGCCVDIKLYPNGRHELLNETIRSEIQRFILCWMEEALRGAPGPCDY